MSIYKGFYFFCGLQDEKTPIILLILRSLCFVFIFVFVFRHHNGKWGTILLNSYNASYGIIIKNNAGSLNIKWAYSSLGSASVS